MRGTLFNIIKPSFNVKGEKYKQHLLIHAIAGEAIFFNFEQRLKEKGYNDKTHYF